MCMHQVRKKVTIQKIVLMRNYSRFFFIIFLSTTQNSIRRF